jgi:hypothetical protein
MLEWVVFLASGNVVFVPHPLPEPLSTVFPARPHYCPQVIMYRLALTNEADQSIDNITNSEDRSARTAAFEVLVPSETCANISDQTHVRHLTLLFFFKKKENFTIHALIRKYEFSWLNRPASANG